MTGLEENARDAGAWQQWWAANADKDPVRFKADLLDRVRRAAPPASAEQLDVMVQDLYRFAGEQQKSDALRVFLTSPDPHVRAAGVRLVELRRRQNSPLPEDAVGRVRDLVGDPSSDVRLQVARFARAINDRASLERLLVQLAQEPDPNVRTAIIEAVGAIRDPRALAELLNLLNDPSMRVAVAAAESLARMGPVLRNDPRRPQVVDRLRQVMNARRGQPGGEELRAACAEALAPLADAATFPLFSSLLDARAESPRTRRAALQGMAAVGAQTADVIIGVLGDRDPTIRTAALDALSAVGSFAYADALFEYTKPEVEPDPAVREAAWRVFQQLLPTAEKRQLIDWAGRRFPNDPARRLPVLIALADKQRADGELRDLAATREDVGAAYLDTGQPDQAVPWFRQALEYWRQANAGGQVVEVLVGRLMDAHLRARQYPEAVRFAEEVMAATPGLQPLVASRITNQAEELLKRDREYYNPRDALRLIAEASKIRPPLNNPYSGFLANSKAEAERALAEAERTPTAPPP